MTELLHRSYDMTVRAPAGAPPEARYFDVVCSTDSVDSYNEIVVQDFDLTRYTKNPVVLYGHNSYSKPIGFGEGTAVKEGKLTSRIHLVTAAANPEAEQVYQLMKQRALRAVSIGFRAKNAKLVEGSDVIALSGCELYEISVVAMPANPDAVVLEARSAENKIIRSLLGEPTKKEAPTMTIPIWHELTPMQRHELAMKDDAVAQKAADASYKHEGKVYEDLTVEETIALYKSDHDKWMRMRTKPEGVTIAMTSRVSIR